MQQGRRLLVESPFFGPEPDALVLLHVARNSRGYSTVWRVLTETFDHRYKDVRWWVGWGPSAFDARPEKRPKVLQRYDFNGDRQTNNSDQDDCSALCVFMGGQWSELVDATRQLSANFVHCGFSISQVDFGYRGRTDRGHNGFIDGTSNLQELDDPGFCRSVFVGNEDVTNAGGSYVVIRKYVEDLELWNDLPEIVQEQMIGRRKGSGYFLHNRQNWSDEAWAHTPASAHVRLARPRSGGDDDWRERMYRRSIPFIERDKRGGIRYGLLFIALNRDPYQQIVRIHNERMLPQSGLQDLLLGSGYIHPVGSWIYFLAADDCASEAIGEDSANV